MAAELLIVKAGDTFEHVSAVHGDSLPGEIAGAVVTGSHSMVTEHLLWSERLAEHPLCAHTRLNICDACV